MDFLLCSHVPDYDFGDGIGLLINPAPGGNEGFPVRAERHPDSRICCIELTNLLPIRDIPEPYVALIIMCSGQCPAVG